jgi:hypothetical protein
MYVLLPYLLLAAEDAGKLPQQLVVPGGRGALGLRDCGPGVFAWDWAFAFSG